MNFMYSRRQTGSGERDKNRETRKTEKETPLNVTASNVSTLHSVNTSHEIRFKMDLPDLVHCQQRVGVEEGIVWDVITTQIKQPWNKTHTTPGCQHLHVMMHMICLCLIHVCAGRDFLWLHIIKTDSLTLTYTSVWVCVRNELGGSEAHDSLLLNYLIFIDLSLDFMIQYTLLISCNWFTQNQWCNLFAFDYSQVTLPPVQITHVNGHDTIITFQK